MSRKTLTNDQILQACKKRLEGSSWEEIGTSFGMHGSHARDCIANALRFKERDSICAEQIDEIKAFIAEMLKRIRMVYRAVRIARKKLHRIEQREKYGKGLAG